MKTYFCNDCFYWFRLGGMMAHTNLTCPECRSGDVVRKTLTPAESHSCADARDERRRKPLAVITAQTPEPVRVESKKKGRASVSG